MNITQRVNSAPEGCLYLFYSEDSRSESLVKEIGMTFYKDAPIVSLHLKAVDTVLVLH